MKDNPGNALSGGEKEEVKNEHQLDRTVKR